PSDVMRPIWLLACSVNHRLPSGPAVMSKGFWSLPGRGHSVTVPVGVIRPILFAPYSVNHRLPPGPAVMAVAWLFEVGIVNSVTARALAGVPVGVRVLVGV